MKKLFFAIVAIAALLAATSSQAAFRLQVTEMWAGNEPNPDLSDDWFELTNYGDTAWTAATDGDLYFDDNSFDAAAAVIMEGIVSIAAGESVIYVNDAILSGSEWSDLWDDVVSPLPQVGYHDGSGLGGGDDGVGIFLDANFDGPQAEELIHTAGYPNADGSPGRSFDVALNRYSVAGQHGALATAPNLNGQPAVGSPGTVPIPEPTSLVLAGCGLAALLASRRK